MRNKWKKNFKKFGNFRKLKKKIFNLRSTVFRQGYQTCNLCVLLNSLKPSDFQTFSNFFQKMSEKLFRLRKTFLAVMSKLHFFAHEKILRKFIVYRKMCILLLISENWANIFQLLVGRVAVGLRKLPFVWPLKQLETFLLLMKNPEMQFERKIRKILEFFLSF